ncbi:MAG: hypothetical protein GY730_03720 [bacterium]|nr:hypothetical protein [bacterium]
MLLNLNKVISCNQGFNPQFISIESEHDESKKENQTFLQLYNQFQALTQSSNYKNKELFISLIFSSLFLYNNKPSKALLNVFFTGHCQDIFKKLFGQNFEKGMKVLNTVLAASGPIQTLLLTHVHKIASAASASLCKNNLVSEKTLMEYTPCAQIIISRIAGPLLSSIKINGYSLDSLDNNCQNTLKQYFKKPFNVLSDILSGGKITDFNQSLLITESPQKLKMIDFCNHDNNSTIHAACREYKEKIESSDNIWDPTVSHKDFRNCSDWDIFNLRTNETCPDASIIDLSNSEIKIISDSIRPVRSSSMVMKLNLKIELNSETFYLKTLATGHKRCNPGNHSDCTSSKKYINNACKNNLMSQVMLAATSINIPNITVFKYGSEYYVGSKELTGFKTVFESSFPYPLANIPKEAKDATIFLKLFFAEMDVHSDNIGTVNNSFYYIDAEKDPTHYISNPFFDFSPTNYNIYVKNNDNDFKNALNILKKITPARVYDALKYIPDSKNNKKAMISNYKYKHNKLNDLCSHSDQKQSCYQQFQMMNFDLICKDYIQTSQYQEKHNIKSRFFLQSMHYVLYTNISPCNTTLKKTHFKIVN